jgi:hypothetical protein
VVVIAASSSMRRALGDGEDFNVEPRIMADVHEHPARSPNSKGSYYTLLLHGFRSYAAITNFNYLKTNFWNQPTTTVAAGQKSPSEGSHETDIGFS